MSNINTSGWELLICPFFAQICRKALSGYLQTEGFSEQGTTSIGGIIYRKLDVFLEISYTPEFRTPNIILGRGPGEYDKNGQPAFVPLWDIIPRDLPERKFTLWTFKTEDDLELLLLRIKSEVLEPYAKPRWINWDLLEASIAKFRTTL